LAGIQRGWFRLQGSQELNPKYDPKADGIIPGVNEAALAIPIALSPDPPLTGERAPPTKYWKLDFVIWAFVINKFLQIMLCGFMWGYNPSPLGTVHFRRPELTIFGHFSKAVSWPYTPPPTKISMRNNVSKQILALPPMPTTNTVYITSKPIFDCAL
jgi:hypothetical protein